MSVHFVQPVSIKIRRAGSEECCAPLGGSCDRRRATYAAACGCTRTRKVRIREGSLLRSLVDGLERESIGALRTAVVKRGPHLLRLGHAIPEGSVPSRVGLTHRRPRISPSRRT